MLDSFANGMRVAVFGTNGGIGRALTDALLASSRVACVHAFARSPQTFDNPKAEPGLCDILEEATIQTAAATCRRQGPLHLVIVATGALHSNRLQPEKTWRALEAAALAESYAINAIGPAMIAKHFLDLLAQKDKAVFAAISARVGSIEDNRLGGWHSYRAAKAALHQLLRTCAIELQRRNPGAACIALHPGTVDTALSKPFQANVSADKLFSPPFAAAQLLSVIDSITPADTGHAYAWDGQRMPF